jgi:glycerol-3-phosphate dehydrogenase
VYPERLVLANLHSAEEYGAELLNYHEVVRFKRNGRKIFSVTAMDKLNSIEKEFEADMVVNSSGPWIDAVLQLGSMIRRRLIGGTRGSHIVVPRFENGPLHAIYTNAMVDGRPFFILPWRNYYLVGTTEVRHEDSQDELFPTYAEIDYLLEETHNCFPAAAPRRQDILFSYAGIRPLPYSTKKNPGAITRKHILIDHSKDGIDNLVSMVGGKLTTYRRMAEQAVDLIGKKTNDTTPSSTAIAPLWGGEPTGSLTATALNQTNQRYRIDETIQQHLIDLYGSHYHEVLELAASRPNGFEKLDSGESDISAQVIFAVKKEWAKKISDVMFRRTPAGLCPNLGFEAYRKAAEIMAVELKWSEIKKNEEIEDYKKFVKRFLLSHQH